MTTITVPLSATGVALTTFASLTESQPLAAGLAFLIMLLALSFFALSAKVSNVGFAAGACFLPQLTTATLVAAIGV